jgi:hypothetical protein
MMLGTVRFRMLITKHAWCAERAKGCKRWPSAKQVPSVLNMSSYMAPLTMMMVAGDELYGGGS